MTNAEEDINRRQRLLELMRQKSEIDREINKLNNVNNYKKKECGRVVVKKKNKQKELNPLHLKFPAKVIIKQFKVDENNYVEDVNDLLNELGVNEPIKVEMIGKKRNDNPTICCTFRKISDKFNLYKSLYKLKQIDKVLRFEDYLTRSEYIERRKYIKTHNVNIKKLKLEGNTVNFRGTILFVNNLSYEKFIEQVKEENVNIINPMVKKLKRIKRKAPSPPVQYDAETISIAESKAFTSSNGNISTKEEFPPEYTSLMSRSSETINESIAEDACSISSSVILIGKNKYKKSWATLRNMVKMPKIKSND